MPNNQQQSLSDIFAPQQSNKPPLADIFSGHYTPPAPETKNPVENYVSGVKDAAVAGVNKVKEGINEAKPAGGASGIGGMVEGVGKILGGATAAITSPLAPAMKPVSDAIGAVTAPISNNPAVQKFAASPAGEATSRVASTVGDFDSAAGLLAGGVKAPEVGATALDAGSDVASTLKTAVKGSPEEQAATQATKAAAKQAKAKDAIDTEIRNTAAKYPTVGKALNKAEAKQGTDPISVLASYPGGKALPTLVKGKLQVDPAVNFLKSQVSQLAETKNNLNFLNENSVPLKDFQQRALDQVDAEKSWSAAKKTDAKAQVSKLMAGMKETYGTKPIPMAEIDKLKTEHTAESTSYNSKSAFSLDAHGIVGKAARDIVSMHADGAPIDELNKLMTSHYAAIDLLNSMRGKAPHGGALSKMTHNVLGEVAGFAGGTAVGHPFLGAMAGRAGAEYLDSVINNHFISNPLKRTIVNNMKGADPKVLQAAKDHLEGLEGNTLQ